MSDKTKSVGGKEYGASEFAYVGDPQDSSTWHLPIPDAAHVRDALARFNQAQVPANKKAEVARKILARAKKFGIDASGFEKEHKFNALDGKWIEIFRAGDYGEKGRYTAEDMARLAESYDPANHEAPVVLGHPENHSPAYGWVQALKSDGDVLMAQLAQVQPEFEELLRSGKFKKRSVALYKGKDGVSLRHVGFLGATPPEVKGLADVKFADGEFREVEFNEEGLMAEDTKKTMMETLKEFFGDLLPNKDKGAKTFSEEDVKRISKEAADAAVKDTQQKLSDLTTKFNESEKRAQSGSTKATAEAAVAKLKADGHWLPAFDKMGAPQIFTQLAESGTEIEFAEGDKKVKKPALQVFADFLGGLKQMVPEGDITKAAGAAKKGGKLIQFSEPTNPNLAVDQESVRFAEAAQELADKEKISYGEALKRVRRQGLPAAAGGASASAV